MKNISFLCLLFALAMFAACSQPTPPTPVAGGMGLGEKISVDSALQLTDLIAKLDKKEGLTDVPIDGGNVVAGLKAKVEGKATSVCKSSGCWVVLQSNDGKEVFVKVQDHAFQIPADVVGKTVVVSGNAYQNITSVEELRHYAKDEGQPQEKILAITEPKVEYQMTVNAVVIKN